MKKLFIISALVLGLVWAGCDEDNSTNPVADNTDIPADPINVTLPNTVMNNLQPTATFSAMANNPGRIQINLTGILDPVTNNPIQLFYDPNNPQGSNIFISEDGVVKGIKVSKVGSGNVLQADVVFTVDNSGSMNEEADSIAIGIINFANFLQASGLDVRFAIVGYDYGVTGGINFSSATQIEYYLNDRTDYYGYQVSGTDRTYGFYGADSADLANKAYEFAPGIWGENGVVGVFFADSNYSWRASAQRVFVNFTDEPTQSDGSGNWNTAQMCNLIAGKATVHTVFSQDSTYWTFDADDERPWEMSQCTGGTVKFIPSDASGLDLTNLPVSGALSNSYLVEYLSGNATATQHTVVVVVKETNADGKTTYNVTY